MSPEDSRRHIAAEVARAIGRELSSESACLCNVDAYGDGEAFLSSLTQRGEDLIAKYIERAIQADREGRSL